MTRMHGRPPALNGVPNGEPYGDELIEEAFGALADLNSSDRWVNAIAEEDTNKLFKLFWAPVATLSGRIRGLCSFTNQRNTPFQGATADGAKVGLWQLYKQSYEVIGFVHDEYTIQIAENTASKTAEQIEQLCIGAM